MYIQVLDANLQSSCRDIVFDPSFSGQVLHLLASSTCVCMYMYVYISYVWI